MVFNVSSKSYIIGNEPVLESLNAEREIRRFRSDPLHPLILKLENHYSEYFQDDIGRYIRAFRFYSLSVERVLKHISIGRRYQKEVRDSYGVGRQFSARQKHISQKYRAQRPFFELDFSNCLLHARILMDRTIKFSRFFLHGSPLPSFSSFSDHQKFFKRDFDTSKICQGSYTEYIAKNTDWFDQTLKPIRDKFIVHNAPKHISALSYPLGDDNHFHDLVMNFMLQVEGADGERIYQISIRRLARDIEAFLTWYCDYSMQEIDRQS